MHSRFVSSAGGFFSAGIRWTERGLSRLMKILHVGYLVREEDRKIIGMIQIRHRLNDFLEKFGGHIGYCIAPEERRNGYGTDMLRLALKECRKIGLEMVLVTCLHRNEGSRRVIMNNGGIFESMAHETNRNLYLERYWIDIS